MTTETLRIVEEMREAIMYEGEISHAKFCEDRGYQISKKRRAKLWHKAKEICEDEDEHTRYLLAYASTTLNEFSNIVNRIYEQGMDCPEIGEQLQIDPKIIRAFL